MFGFRCPALSTWSSSNGKTKGFLLWFVFTSPELPSEDVDLMEAHGSRFLWCCALGALCAVGDAAQASTTHTAGMSCMQSIESVSRRRQLGEEKRWGSEGSPVWWRQGAWGGVFFLFYHYFMKKKLNARFPPTKNFSINLFSFFGGVGNYQWRSITVVWSSACERRGEMWRETWDGGERGLGEVKGQRKKGGTFSEDGRLEKTEGTMTSMFKRLFSASATPHTGSSLKPGRPKHEPLMTCFHDKILYSRL